MKYLILSIFTATMIMAIGSIGGIHAEDKAMKSMSVPVTAPIQTKNYSGLLGMAGFSDPLLNNHFKLYLGYVTNTNILLGKLKALLLDNKDKTPGYAELKRRLGWEFNGVLLHELYFENLGGKNPIDSNSSLYKKITEHFGSFSNWRRDFISTGLMRGIGWVVLYWEPRTGKLINAWINEHHIGNIVAAKPLLVMDVFEHAYMSDYQLDKAKYIDLFFKNINWKRIAERFGE